MHGGSCSEKHPLSPAQVPTCLFHGFVPLCNVCRLQRKSALAYGAAFCPHIEGRIHLQRVPGCHRGPRSGMPACITNCLQIPDSQQICPLSTRPVSFMQTVTSRRSGRSTPQPVRKAGCGVRALGGGHMAARLETRAQGKRPAGSAPPFP